MQCISNDSEEVAFHTPIYVIITPQFKVEAMNTSFAAVKPARLLVNDKLELLKAFQVGSCEFNYVSI